jgi:hypothetical protein
MGCFDCENPKTVKASHDNKFIFMITEHAFLIYEFESGKIIFRRIFVNSISELSLFNSH